MCHEILTISNLSISQNYQSLPYMTLPVSQKKKQKKKSVADEVKEYSKIMSICKEKQVINFGSWNLVIHTRIMFQIAV